jgi:hypothetical protein
MAQARTGNLVRTFAAYCRGQRLAANLRTQAPAELEVFVPAELPDVEICTVLVTEEDDSLAGPRGSDAGAYGNPRAGPASFGGTTIKTMAPWDLMAQAAELRKEWQAALDEYATAKVQGRAAAEIAKLDAAQDQLKGAYLTKAKAATGTF